jgi:outer membrane biosynthesis protein TonB
MASALLVNTVVAAAVDQVARRLTMGRAATPAFVSEVARKLARRLGAADALQLVQQGGDLARCRLAYSLGAAADAAALLGGALQEVLKHDHFASATGIVLGAGVTAAVVVMTVGAMVQARKRSLEAANDGAEDATVENAHEDKRAKVQPSETIEDSAGSEEAPQQAQAQAQAQQQEQPQEQAQEQAQAQAQEQEQEQEEEQEQEQEQQAHPDEQYRHQQPAEPQQAAEEAGAEESEASDTTRTCAALALIRPCEPQPTAGTGAGAGTSARSLDPHSDNAVTIGRVRDEAELAGVITNSIRDAGVAVAVDQVARRPGARAELKSVRTAADQRVIVID